MLPTMPDPVVEDWVVGISVTGILSGVAVLVLVHAGQPHAAQAEHDGLAAVEVAGEEWVVGA